MQRRRVRMVCLLLSLLVLGLLLAGCNGPVQTLAVIRLLQDSEGKGVVPYMVEFDGSASVGVNEIITYRWDFGDGVEAFGQSVTYTFNHAGLHEVRLTVRAADGSVNTATISIEVEPAFWVADENLDKIYKLNQTGSVLYTFDSPATRPRGLALAIRDGRWSLFVSCTGNGIQRLFEIDPETGDVVEKHTAPAHSPGELAFDRNVPRMLWHLDRSSRMIYEINPADGRVINQFGAGYFQAASHMIGSVFLQTPRGIAWKGDAGEPGSLWVLESETKLLYELVIVPAINIFASTQLAIQPDPIALAPDLFPISGLDWYDGFLWVAERDRGQITQVDPTTGEATGIVLPDFPRAAITGLAIQY